MVRQTNVVAVGAFVHSYWMRFVVVEVAALLC